MAFNKIKTSFIRQDSSRNEVKKWYAGGDLGDLFFWCVDGDESAITHFRLCFHSDAEPSGRECVADWQIRKGLRFGLVGEEVGSQAMTGTALVEYFDTCSEAFAKRAVEFLDSFGDGISERVRVFIRTMLETRIAGAQPDSNSSGDKAQ